ncbi:hypothetical protein IWQ60_006678 [Tieghemiomyces parasiticus]|uniref:Nicotinamide-nucleotide adenylyltransferase n=1 Tax=Tieghemiomyces parasiticus TaxID=78921 RepID=A0A9W8DXD4_9FUNG|nr:hypothetical protein IWQ60_006678 [Tieghemiomyces parasiticus]
MAPKSTWAQHAVEAFVQRSRARSPSPSGTPASNGGGNLFELVRSPTSKVNRPTRPPNRITGGTNPPPPSTHRRDEDLVVLDASFNPPTVAHTRLLQRALERRPTVTLREWMAGAAAFGASATANSSNGPGSSSEADHLKSEASILPPSGLPSFTTGVLLLATTNADKKLSGASLAQRLAMVDLTSSVITEQLRRNSPSESQQASSDKADASGGPRVDLGLTNGARFIDKLRALRDHYFPSTTGDQSVTAQCTTTAQADRDDSEHGSPQPHIYFVMGMDTLIRFFDPKYYPDAANADHEAGATVKVAANIENTSPPPATLPLGLQRTMDEFFGPLGGRLVVVLREGAAERQLVGYLLPSARSPTLPASATGTAEGHGAVAIALRHYAPNVYLMDCAESPEEADKLMSMSSTKVRQAVARCHSTGRSLDTDTDLQSMLTEPVRRYIEVEGLYWD